jgi:hypothetical protein
MTIEERLKLTIGNLVFENAALFIALEKAQAELKDKEVQEK